VLLDQKRIEEAFRLLEAGKESFRSLEAKLGVPKSTLQRWYTMWLEKRIEERRKALTEIEGKISKLSSELSELESRFNRKRGLLEEKYKAEKASLEKEISALKREAAKVKSVFEAQGFTFEEGLKILGEVKSLRDEKESLKGQIAKLRAEIPSLESHVKHARLTVLQLEKGRESLQNAISSLSLTYRGYLWWLQSEKPKIEQQKTQLENTIKSLKEHKARLESEITMLQTEMGELMKNVKELEEAKKALTAVLEAEKEKTNELLRKARSWPIKS